MIKRSKTTDSSSTNKFHSQDNNIALILNINNVKYHYYNSDELYEVFKLENKLNIYCEGILDKSVNCKKLIHNQYEIKSIIYNDINFDLIYKLPLNHFNHPLYISLTSKMNITNFIHILPFLIENLI